MALQWVDAHPDRASYLDLEDPQDRLKVLDSDSFFQASAGKLVVLDEVQCLPEIFATLRGQVDRRRRAGHRTGQFLVLGSASLDMLHQSAESLAGRIAYSELAPFHLGEVDPTMAPNDSQGAVRRLWTRGGFPDSFLAHDDAQSLAWRQAFILALGWKTWAFRPGMQSPTGVLARFNSSAFSGRRCML